MMVQALVSVVVGESAEQRMEQGQKTGVADLLVRVWGMGANGRAFFQNVYARELTSSGGLLSGMDHLLTTGDVIGVQLNEKKARFRVVNVHDAGLPVKIQVHVELMNGQECPWKDHVIHQPGKPAVASKPNNKRR